ncbi:MAG: hypothetical protein Q9219_006403 [cf. Caloplaca sp. 3 TL-2023]
MAPRGGGGSSGGGGRASSFSGSRGSSSSGSSSKGSSSYSSKGSKGSKDSKGSKGGKHKSKGSSGSTYHGNSPPFTSAAIPSSNNNPLAFLNLSSRKPLTPRNEINEVSDTHGSSWLLQGCQETLDHRNNDQSPGVQQYSCTLGTKVNSSRETIPGIVCLMWLLVFVLNAFLAARLYVKGVRAKRDGEEKNDVKDGLAEKPVGVDVKGSKKSKRIGC